MTIGNSTISASNEAIKALRRAVVMKHGVFRGPFGDEVNRALLAHAKRLTSETSARASG